MNRRRLLAVCSTLPLAAGCTGAPAGGGDAPDDTPTGSDGTDPTPTAGARRCPPFETARDRAVCSHTVKRDAGVFVAATPKRSRLDDGRPAEEVTLTLHNRSDVELSFNPHSWRIHHDGGDGWTELDRETAGDGETTVAAGGTRSWSLLEAVESVRPDPDLDPGRHAAELGVPDPAGDGWVACIAFVRLEAGK